VEATPRPLIIRTYTIKAFLRENRYNCNKSVQQRGGAGQEEKRDEDNCPRISGCTGTDDATTDKSLTGREGGNGEGVDNG